MKLFVGALTKLRFVEDLLNEALEVSMQGRARSKLKSQYHELVRGLTEHLAASSACASEHLNQLTGWHMSDCRQHRAQRLNKHKMKKQKCKRHQEASAAGQNKGRKR